MRDYYGTLSEMYDEICERKQTNYMRTVKSAVKHTIEILEIAMEEEKKNFNLAEYLKETIKPREFVVGRANEYFKPSIFNSVEITREFNKLDPNQVYFKVDDWEKIEDKLREMRVSITDIYVAYKELGWIKEEKQ